MRRAAVPVYGVLALLMTMAGTACGRDSRSEPASDTVSAVGTPADKSAAPAAIAACSKLPRASDSSPSERAWISSDGAREARQPIESVLNDRFGVPQKDADTLASGYLGQALDNVRRQIVVVVDEAVVEDGRQLEERLQRAGTERHAEDSSLPVIGVRVQASCISTEKLEEARKVIQAEEWHPDAKGSVRSYGLAPEVSAYRVRIGGPNASAVQDALAERLGDAVVFA